MVKNFEDTFILFDMITNVMDGQTETDRHHMTA